MEYFMNNECQICSLSSTEHDRGMTLVHPLMRHAFVDGFEKDAQADVVTPGAPKGRMDELTVARRDIERRVKKGELLRSRSFQRSGLIQIPAEKFQFRRLDSIATDLAYNALRSKHRSQAGSGSPSMDDMEGARALRRALEDTSEAGVDARDRELEEMQKRMGPLRNAEISRWRAAAAEEFTPVMGLVDQTTGHTFEVYGDRQGLTHILGPDGALTSHEKMDFHRTADKPVFERLKEAAKHIWGHHYPVPAEKKDGSDAIPVRKDRAGKDVTIKTPADEPSFYGPKFVSIEQDGPEVPEGVTPMSHKGGFRIDLEDPALTAESQESLRSHLFSRAVGGVKAAIKAFKGAVDAHDALPAHTHHDDGDGSAFYFANRNEDPTKSTLETRTDSDLGVAEDPSITIHNMITKHLKPNPFDPEIDEDISALLD